MCCFVTDVLTKRLIGEKADRCDECGAETIGRALAWLARALREPAAAPYAAQHIASVEAFFASRGEKPLLCTSRRMRDGSPQILATLDEFRGVLCTDPAAELERQLESLSQCTAQLSALGCVGISAMRGLASPLPPTSRCH
jgi:hypothetical protein